MITVHEYKMYQVVQTAVTEMVPKLIAANLEIKQKLDEAPDYMNYSQAAGILGVDRSTISRMVKEGKIETTKTACGLKIHKNQLIPNLIKEYVRKSA
jgi:excisionase family DNA binding protein